MTQRPPPSGRSSADAGGQPHCQPHKPLCRGVPKTRFPSFQHLKLTYSPCRASRGNLQTQDPLTSRRSEISHRTRCRHASQAGRPSLVRVRRQTCGVTQRGRVYDELCTALEDSRGQYTTPTISQHARKLGPVGAGDPIKCLSA